MRGHNSPDSCMGCDPVGSGRVAMGQIGPEWGRHAANAGVLLPSYPLMPQTPWRAANFMPREPHCPFPRATPGRPCNHAHAPRAEPGGVSSPSVRDRPRQPSAPMPGLPIAVCPPSLARPLRKSLKALPDPGNCGRSDPLAFASGFEGFRVQGNSGILKKEAESWASGWKGQASPLLATPRHPAIGF